MLHTNIKSNGQNRQSTEFTVLPDIHAASLNMRIGDLVKNGQGHIGVVTGIGYTGYYKTYLDSPCLNPDIHVVTPSGTRIWSYKALEILNEAR